MGEKPILFKTEMVKAIMEGRKSVTRRLVKPQPAYDCSLGDYYKLDKVIGHTFDDGEGPRLCPYGGVGGFIWVRETWADVNTESGPGIAFKAGDIRFCSDDAYPVEYDRYPGCSFSMWYGDLMRGEEGHKWRPSIFMPRWASRISLEITGIRVERLGEITTEQIIAEGFSSTLREHDAVCDLRQQFEAKWDQINAKEASFQSNPWVWVIGFRRAESQAARRAA